MNPTKEELVKAGVRLVKSPVRDRITGRMIAKEAKLNHALISYHFGGLEQLLEAVFDACIDEIHVRLLPLLNSFKNDIEMATPLEYKELLKRNISSLITVLNSSESTEIFRATASSYTRAPKGLYPRISEDILAPIFEVFCFFIRKVRAEGEDPFETAILAQLMLAHCMAFFRGGALVNRYMGWHSSNKERQAKIVDISVEKMLNMIGL